MLPLFVKYAPKSLREFVGQKKGIAELKQFIEDFSKKNTKKACLLFGPPGCGKTAAVYALANDMQLEVLELNASDFRNKEIINKVVGEASKQRSLFSFAKGKLLLIEEVDGMSGNEDKGGLSALREVIAQSKFPVIMTANDAYTQKLVELRRLCKLIQFNELTALEVYKIIKRIVQEEKLDISDFVLMKIARFSEGDARAAINDIHSFSNEVGLVDDMRDKKESILKALMKVLKTVDVDVALRAFDRIDVDFDECILWLDENLPREYKDAESLAKAYDILSKVDVLRGRILRRQHWGFLGYMYNLATAGVALSKKQKLVGYVKYQRNDRILKMWIARRANSKLEEVLRKIAKKTHSSVNKVRKDFRFYIKILQDKSVAKWIGLSDDESSLIFSK